MASSSNPRKRSKKAGSSKGKEPEIPATNTYRHGSIEAWFEGDEERIEKFQSHISRKAVNSPKVLSSQWLEDEGLTDIIAMIQHQDLQKFLELNGFIYPDLVKVFYTNLKHDGSVLTSKVKGTEMVINNSVWKRIGGFKTDGIVVSRGLCGSLEDFNKVQTYRECLRNSQGSVRGFQVGGLTLTARVLTFIITWMITPRGSNHATMNEGDLLLLFCLMKSVRINWIHIIKDHMMKSKRLPDYRLPYAVIISKFFEYFGVDIRGEQKISIGRTHQLDNSFLFKFGFTKSNGTWTAAQDTVNEGQNSAGTSAGAGTATDEAGNSEAGAEGYSMGDIVPYVPPVDRGPPLSLFEQAVFQRFDAIQSHQQYHHNYCINRFGRIDQSIEDLHAQLAQINMGSYATPGDDSEEDND